jgi:hypothetical protein
LSKSTAQSIAEEAFLNPVFPRKLAVIATLPFQFRFWLVVLALCSGSAFSQNAVTLDNNESIFAALSGINACGYDAELQTSDPQRLAIRREVGSKIEASVEAKSAAESLCNFYRDHQQPDDARTLSQYISLALYLSPPPALTPNVKEADLPPDASAVLGFVPLLSKFYDKAGIHQIWEQHSAAYAALADQYRPAFTQMIQKTELYLRLPSGSYEGRNFSIFVDPMGAPSATNARNYAMDYFVVITPGTNVNLKMEPIRHAFLHYLLDPMIGRYSTTFGKLDPLMDAVKLAPMDESFKEDPSLLVTECAIRAVEARTLADGKAPLPEQNRAVDISMQQGFVLTRYFYERLLLFEKDSIGFRNSLGPIVAQIDVRKEMSRTSQIQFAEKSEPELLHLARPKQTKLLVSAEERLSAGDSATAEKLARQALAEKTEDPGRALFILAELSLNRNVNGARDYFEQALKATSEPKIVAWSHIYLGRILDLQDDDEGGPLRASAIAHYKAAAEASASLPEAKAAAEQGIEKPYEHHKAPEQNQGAEGEEKK